MKRSEMLKLMSEAYSDRAKHRMLYFDISDADQVLMAIELAGMQPPPHQEEHGTGYPDEYGNETTQVEWVQGWEAE